jgi:predicted DNA-binding WGR domain protein
MRWINEEKRRYYQAALVRDLFDSWVLVTAWGSVDSQRGNMHSTAVESFEDGQARMQALARRRRQRGYRLVDVAVSINALDPDDNRLDSTAADDQASCRSAGGGLEHCASID